MPAETVIRPVGWRWHAEALKGVNERCVELPLAGGFVRLWQPGRVLDAGCALNHAIAGDFPAELTHLTLNLANEKQYPHPHRAYVQGDFRALPFPDQSFDRVVCISSLEHVGCDNSRYDAPVETCPETVPQATAELWRVTAHDILITVPMRLTPWRERGWRYFTPETLAEVIPAPADVVFYRKAEDGWWGPFDEPADTPFDDEPWRVPQIAVIYACR